tara:strand:- start:907 stop:3819 length:2913 start_codon:yes stop_codon:yes gene_type:complete
MSIPGSGSPLLLASSAAADAVFAEIENSLRFNTDDSAYLSKTFSSAGNRKKFTFACWLKRTKLGGRQTLFRTNSSELHFSFAESAQGNEDAFFCYGAGGSPYLVSDAVFKDVGGWYHFCIAWDTTQSTSTDRLKLFVNGERITSWKTSTFPNQNYEGGLNSATAHGLGANSSGGERFDGYLADIYFIDGTAHDASTFGAYDDNNVWQATVPSGLTFGTNGFHLKFASTATTAALGTDSSGNSNTFTANNFAIGGSVNVIPSGTGLDGYIPSGWTRTNDADDVLVNNTTGVFVNQSGSLYFGITPTSSSITIKWIVYDGSGTYNPTVSLNTSSSWNGTTVHPSVSGSGSASSPAVGTYSVTAGTTYYVRTGLTGNGNPALVVYATNVNIVTLSTDNNPADASKDSPTTDTTNTDTGAGGEVSGNYCILNRFKKSDSIQSLSDGNLKIKGNIDNDQTWGTIAVSSGKWYFESKITVYSGSQEDGFVGVSEVYNTNFQEYVGKSAYSYGISVADYFTYMKKYNNNNPIDTNLTSPTEGDVIGVALDLDNGKIYFHKNGTYANSGNPANGTNAAYTGLSGTFTPAVTTSGSTGGTVEHTFNFGSKPFAYNAPSGFKALCTTNLPTPTVPDGSLYFDTKLYTGSGTSYLNSQTISGLSFSPDFLWIKCRSNTSDHHLANTVNGINKNLESNNTAANQTNNANGYISATTSDGFTVVYGGGNGLQTNDNSKTYAAWAWKAASSTASNTDGSITSSVRANPTAGFSIVAWTSSSSVSTVGHGLNAAPHFIITKNRSTTNAWWSYHSSLGNTKAIRLDSTDTPSTMSSTWNNTSPTSSVFTVGGEFGNGNNMIAYCISPVAGYSAVGSYEGNGVNDGPFSWTGFAPAFVMFRRYDGAGDWIIFDNKRNTYPRNFREKVLYPNKTTAEETSANGDTMLFLSNGFKINNVNYAYWNQSGADYLWVAFAENPFQANGGLAR